MRSKLIIALVLLLATTTSAARKSPRKPAAAEPVPEPPMQFNSYDSGICLFNLHKYKLSKPIESAIVFGVTKILDTYKDDFGFPYPDNFKVKITIINRQQDFEKYQKQRIGKIISTRGYFSGRHRETVVWKNKNTKEMLDVLFHEASHMILRDQVDFCPNWLNEGLAEYFAGLNVVGKNKRIYINENRYKWIKHWLKNGFPIKIDEYINLTHKQWNKLSDKDSNVAYSIGYSLTYFMMSNKKTEKILKNILWEFQRQGYKARSVDIINTHFPGGYPKFEKMWRNWIPRAKKYRPLRALKKETKTPDDKPHAKTPAPK